MVHGEVLDFACVVGAGGAGRRRGRHRWQRCRLPESGAPWAAWDECPILLVARVLPGRAVHYLPSQAAGGRRALLVRVWPPEHLDLAPGGAIGRALPAVARVQGRTSSRRLRHRRLMLVCAQEVGAGPLPIADNMAESLNDCLHDVIVNRRPVAHGRVRDGVLVAPHARGATVLPH